LAPVSNFGPSKKFNEVRLAMVEQDTAPNDSFRSFVTRHDRLITTFGALLVVGAFYAQDVKLPPLAKMTADIDAARAESADITYLNSKIDDLGAALSDRLASEKKIPLIGIQNNIRGSSQDFDSAQDDLGIANIIAARLPLKRQNLIEKGANLTRQIDGLRNQESIVLSDLDAANLTALQGIPDPTILPSYVKLMGAAGPFVTASAAFKKAVANFSNDVSNETEAQADSLKTQTARWERISEALVILGFAASVLSKLLKIPALGGEPGP
jgi:hypothetical protein